jgi:[acyl-carrier-protein] S-malonyltransferase
MSKTCFLFAGQGSQSPGMGKEILEIYPEGEQIFTLGSEILGYDLKAACFELPAEELARTEYSQPAIMAVSLLCYEAVCSLGIRPDMVAGHSLGEYAAAAAAGILSYENAFRVIRARAHAMGECAKRQNGAMCAVIGLPAEEVEAVCAGIGRDVLPVNYNSPVQTVIAGTAEAVEAAVAAFTEKKSRCMKLAVSAAFHTRFMQPAADEFLPAVSGIPFAPAQLDFYSNLTGAVLTDFSDMPGYFARHLTSPVRFTKELEAIQASGADRFIECGPNKILTGLVRKTLDGVTAYNVDSAKTFEKLKAAL